MRIALNGNVGIGTTSPGQKLSVAGTIESTTGGFKFPDGTVQTTVATGSGDGHSLDAADGSPTDVVFVDNNGNVGIGTTSPIGKLDVAGGLSLGSYAGVNSPPSNGMIISGSVGIATNNPGSAKFAVRGNSVLGGTDGSPDASLEIVKSTTTDLLYISSAANNDGDLFVVKNSGNVGIGTSTPNNIFQVDSLINFDNATFSTMLGFQAGSNSTGVNNTFNGYRAGFNNIDGTDNTFNGYQAGFNNTTGVTNTFIGREAGWSNQTGSGNVFLGFQAGFVETGSNKLYIDNGPVASPLIYGDFSANTVTFNGNVGIGTTSPNVALDVIGSIEYTGTITDVSDQRLKENIKPIENALDKILTINGISYNLIGDKTIELGVIAQDVQQTIPEVVKVVDPENGYLGVSYLQLVPVLIEAVKEQQKIIDEQKVENEAMKAKMARFESTLLRLESKIAANRNYQTQSQGDE